MTGEQHERAVEAGKAAIHSGKGCTCRRGAHGDAQDAIDAYHRSLAEQGVRLVDLAEVVGFARHSAGRIRTMSKEQACADMADALERRFDPAPSP